MEEHIIAVAEVEGEKRTTYIGKRYLCGNFIVEEYGNSMMAAEAFAEAVELDELAREG